MQLTSRTCRWPIDDPRSADFCFCGATSVRGRPYCEFHLGVAYHAPPQQTIAAKARCAISTVAEAIKMLEAARILTWCNRRARVRIGGVVKVIRVSNSYRFLDPGSKSELQSGTKNQDSSSLVKPAEIQPIDPEGPLERAIALGKKTYGRA